MVLLTAREHYICHLLLVKMVSGKERMKMSYAFLHMQTINDKIIARYTSKLYEYHRKNFHEYMIGYKKPEGFAVGPKNTMYGKKHTKESKLQMSITSKANVNIPKMILANPFRKQISANGVIYDSIRDMHRKTGITRRHINRDIKLGIYALV